MPAGRLTTLTRSGEALTTSEPAGLYLHVPFCARKCAYCDFYSVTDGDAAAFVGAVARELALHRDRFDTFGTLYLGGGTPSVLTDDALLELVVALGAHLTPGSEITVEANPDDLDADRLTRWRAAGVDRLSLGIQSLDDDLLRWLGRRHDAAQALAAVDAAREAGFDDLSLDFMYGIPGQRAAAWADTLDRVVDLGAEHLSCYQLTFAPGTPLGRRAESGEISPPDDEASRDLFIATSERLTTAGYEHYEVSNFARPGRRSRHNSGYWRRTPYLGLGPSAHSFDGARRWWNVRSVSGYVDALVAGDSAVEEAEVIDAEQARLEALMLGLRTSDGVALDVVGVGREEDLASAVEEGLICSDGRVLRPSIEGLIVADALALSLF